jgi:hypothetical protein
LFNQYTVILSEVCRVTRVPGGRSLPDGVVGRQTQSKDLRLFFVIDAMNFGLTTLWCVSTMQGAGAPYLPRSLRQGWKTTNLMRAKSERLAPPQGGDWHHRSWCLQIISLLCCTMIPEVVTPPSRRKWPRRAETSRNSLSWTILRITLLF